jgi:hypothetical protein
VDAGNVGGDDSANLVAAPLSLTEDADCQPTTSRVCLNLRLTRKRVQPRNRMRENRTAGSVRGVPGNWRSYCERSMGRF